MLLKMNFSENSLDINQNQNMGIKHFFQWLKRTFPGCMQTIPRSQRVGVSIDNVLIDMNGIIHNAAQKVFQYGKHKPIPRLIRGKNKAPIPTRTCQELELELFKEVCNAVNEWVSILEPKKRLVLCVDGPAPMSKQNQQRQRRFRSARDAEPDASFDATCITPGTRFMDSLDKYIDWYIRFRMSFDKNWSGIEVVYTGEKVPGEGEAKCFGMIRAGTDEESYCVIGNDADLIMLALATHKSLVYVLREDMYIDENLFLVNVSELAELLTKEMAWECDTFSYLPQAAVNDFIFLCFFVGNDFLPHIPTIEIIENGIELIIDVYKAVCTDYGHITYTRDGKVLFDIPAFAEFLASIGTYEKELLENKISKKESYFPDKILFDSGKQNPDGTWSVNIDGYINTFISAKFPGENMKTVSHEFIEGMQWVLSYYTSGVPNWKWFYKYHHAPPSSILAKHCSDYKRVKYGKTTPSLPFQQLLRVLPPSSAHLLPEPLSGLLSDEDSPLAKYCPKTIEVDLAGKRQEWEGTVIICNMNEKDMIREYTAKKHLLNEEDLSRNIVGETYKYTAEYEEHVFESNFGTLKTCIVDREIL